MKDFPPIWLYFENGTYIRAKSFGKGGTRVGEAVFNTSLTGYQEILTDPSYAGQFVVFTMPEIGIVGTNEDDCESSSIHALGAIIRSLSLVPSNFRSSKDLRTFVNEYNGFGICDIDTRYLTKMLRNEGAMMMVASTEISSKEELKKVLEKSPKISQIDYTKQVSTKQPYAHKMSAWDYDKMAYKKAKKSEKKIIVIDFGVKKSILNQLCNSGLSLEVIPCEFDEKNLIERYKKGDISGFFLSNGPGEPLLLKKEVQKLKALIKAHVPMFGICLGHQLLCIAHGYPTYKLKFGQHGGNHPVLDAQTGRVEITAQNHNYNAPKEIEKIAHITHTNLFDGTIEGLSYKDEPIFSVQHHPEASPGPHESVAIFDKFAQSL